jgi:hypothetical protein
MAASSDTNVVITLHHRGIQSNSIAMSPRFLYTGLASNTSRGRWLGA